MTDPELRQLTVALAMVAFAGLFFLGRGVGDSSAADPVAADLQPATAQGVETASLAFVAVAARLPSLQSQEEPRKPEKPRKPAAERPSQPKPSTPSPAAQDVPVAAPPSAETVEPAVEPAPASVPAPTPTPTPEPAPAPEPIRRHRSFSTTPAEHYGRAAPGTGFARGRGPGRTFDNRRRRGADTGG